MAEALSHIQENRPLASLCCPSVCLPPSPSPHPSFSLSLSEYISSAQAKRIFEKFEVENFYKNMSRNYNCFVIWQKHRTHYMKPVGFTLLAATCG